MLNLESILYASHATGDESEALKQAMSQARNHEARLQVLVVYPPVSDELEEYREKFTDSLLQQARESVRATRNLLGLDDDAVEVSFQLVSDEKSSTRIIREVLRREYDLVIKEAEIPGRGEGFWAIDMELLRKCPCPVWLSRPIDRPRREIEVAVAVDPESKDRGARQLSVNLIQSARALADDCSGTLHVVACTDYPRERFMRNNPWTKMAAPEIEKAKKRAMGEHREMLDEMIAEAGGAGEHQVHHFHGEAAGRIPKFVHEAEIDILVMGTVARKGISGILLGNTAENIAQSLSCSLIVLKPAEFESPVDLD